MSAAPPFGLPSATLEKLHCVFARHGAIRSVLMIAHIDRVGVEIYARRSAEVGA